MSDQETNDRKLLPPPHTWMPRRGVMVTSALAFVLIAGAALGAGGTRFAQNLQPKQVVLLQPVTIDKISDGSPVAIKGDVAEVFGNKFIVQDGTGRALVDTGPRGEDRTAAVKGETITVQGRFERGVVRADLIAHADGRNEAFGPPGPPRGPKGPKGSRGPTDGPRADRGPPPSEEDDAPTPPRPR